MAKDVVSLSITFMHLQCFSEKYRYIKTGLMQLGRLQSEAAQEVQSWAHDQPSKLQTDVDWKNVGKHYQPGQQQRWGCPFLDGATPLHLFGRHSIKAYPQTSEKQNPTSNCKLAVHTITRMAKRSGEKHNIFIEMWKVIFHFVLFCA